MANITREQIEQNIAALTKGKDLAVLEASQYGASMVCVPERLAAMERDIAEMSTTIAVMEGLLEREVASELYKFPDTRFTEVMPGIELGYDFLGGIDIRLGGEFVYVHVNYDYKYTDNSGRTRLAENIVKLICGGRLVDPSTNIESSGSLPVAT